MKTLIALIGRIEKAAAVLAALALAALFLLGLAEVTLRTLFSYSIPISLEYSGYLVAASFLLGSGWTLSQDRHVRLAIFENRPAIETLATGIALALSLGLSYGLAAWAIGSFEKGDVSFFPSATPLWIPQGGLALGALVLSLSLLKRLLSGAKP